MPSPLGSRTWEELEVVRHDSGHLLFTDCIRRKAPDGSFEERPCKVWVPQPQDHTMARIEARGWFGKHKDLDPDRDKDLFEEIEKLYLLSHAIRRFEPPHPQLLGYDELVQYDEGSLADVQERINAYKALLDPRADKTIGDDPNKFWELLLDVRRVGHLGPLVAIAPHEQPFCIMRTVHQALLSPRAPSYVQSSVSSMPEPSPQES